MEGFPGRRRLLAAVQLTRRVLWESRRLALQRSFTFWQTLGVHVTPNHYYGPVPDTRHLPASLWSQRLQSPGVDMRDAEQVALLQTFASSFRAEYGTFPMSPHAGMGKYYVKNGMFESVDGEILYCMIRHFRPKRLIEVGAGVSTVLSAQAVLRNASHGDPCEFVSIDPFPTSTLQAGLDGLSELLAKPVQEVGLDVFMQLARNDILFIDSSHVVRIGGDVLYELLEILPQLAVGVVVHLHDIFMPAEYPKNWVLKNKRFWSEQYLLQAFLAFNREFEVLWGSSYMHLMHPEMLEAAFPSYRRDRWWPASFWIRRVA
jgi:hypothetical protein